VLVAFTDGISEAMNPADEEWGDDRLILGIRSNLAAAAGDLIVHIVRAADTFVAGAPQHDDMTTIVVRVE
jgi:serine phosphatase RsbU (regulator of sigma subunit)